MSRVDVIIPCYNYAHFLRECVQSVLTQDKVEVRALIIDDESPDNTPEVAAKLTREDHRVEYRRHEKNKGHIATYNEGLDWASGDYLLLLSADDLLTPGALARATRLMDIHTELGFSFGKAIVTDNPSAHWLFQEEECRWRILTGPEFWELNIERVGDLVRTPTAVVRTSLQKRVGGYRKDLPHTGDLEMWMRLAAHASVGALNADQAFYRVHGQNMHAIDFADRDTVFQQHWEAFEGLFREFGDRIPGSERLQQRARRALALHTLSKASKSFERGDAMSCETLLDAALLQYPQLSKEKATPSEAFAWAKSLGLSGWLHPPVAWPQG